MGISRLRPIDNAQSIYRRKQQGIGLVAQERRKWRVIKPE